jgi:HpaII restriction endonuclease
MIKGNKGEWSEIYTLLKVISDKTLFAGDSDLNKIEHLIFPIIKVIRSEKDKDFEFSYENDLVVVKNDSEEVRISISDFQKQAFFLLTKMKEKTNGTFSIPEVEEFINSFNSTSLKAKSSVKTDIKIVIHDQRIGTNSELGFSIKSQIGGSSTLLNAGHTTNFIFKINCLDLTENEINEINSIDTKSKVKDRVQKIIELGGKLVFDRAENSIFANNLMLIDSALPTIIT